MNPDSSRRSIELWLVFAVAIWAVNYPIAKYGISGLDSFIFNAIRYVVATVTIFFMFQRPMQWTPIAGRDRFELFRAGFIANVIYQIAFIIGLSMTTAGNTAVLLSTSPLWTVFISAKMHKEKIPRSMWWGMFVSFLGIVLIILGSGKKLALGRYELFGDLIVLAAASLWGLSTNLQKPLLLRYSPHQIAFVMVAIGGIGLSVIAVPSALTMNWASVHWTYYTAAIVSGAFSIGISNVIWSAGVQRLGPGRTANFNNLVPVLAFILSYFMLDEQLLPIQIVGAVITVAGVWIVRR